MADINLQSLFPGPIGAMEQTQALGTLGRKIEEENLSNEKARMANDLQSMLQQNQSYRDAYLAGQTGTQQSLAAKGQADKLNYEQMVRTYGPDTMAKIGKAVSGAMDNVANLAQRVLDSSPTATGADVVATIQQAMPELTQSPQGQKLVQQYSTMDRQSLLQQLQKYNRNRGDFAALADPTYHKQMDVAEIKGEYGLAGHEITAENQMAMLNKKIQAQFELAKEKAKSNGKPLTMSQYEAQIRTQAAQGDASAKQQVADLDNARVMSRLAGNPAGYKPSVDIGKVVDMPMRPSPVEQALTATKNAWKQEQGAPKAGIPTQAPSSNVETIQRNLALLEKELKSTPANSDRARILQEEYLTEKQKLANLGVAQPTPQTPVGTLSTGNTFKIRKTQ